MRAAADKATRAAWMIGAIAVLWWPSHLSGPLDGAPLDAAADAILLGLLVPLLCCLHASFLDGRRVRVLLVALVAWKALTTSILVQDGWCVALSQRGRT
jgi:hypothetical protein